MGLQEITTINNDTRSTPDYNNATMAKHYGGTVLYYTMLRGISLQDHLYRALTASYLTDCMVKYSTCRRPDESSISRRHIMRYCLTDSSAPPGQT